VSAIADAYDHQEEACPIAFGSKRCSACGQIKPLEGDGMCAPCLNYKALPARSHVPKPRYRITVRKGSEIVYGPEDVVQEATVIKIRDWFRDEPFPDEYVFSVDYINSKAGVLR
jgi:hypothetical protein